ncbi:unnamed protein product [Musa acuminata subsp. burmannicoides]
MTAEQQEKRSSSSSVRHTELIGQQLQRRGTPYAGLTLTCGP